MNLVYTRPLQLSHVKRTNPLYETLLKDLDIGDTDEVRSIVSVSMLLVLETLVEGLEGVSYTIDQLTEMAEELNED